MHGVRGVHHVSTASTGCIEDLETELFWLLKLGGIIPVIDTKVAAAKAINAPVVVAIVDGIRWWRAIWRCEGRLRERDARSARNTTIIKLIFRHASLTLQL
jgi:hypothetical protein